MTTTIRGHLQSQSHKSQGRSDTNSNSKSKSKSNSKSITTRGQRVAIAALMTLSLASSSTSVSAINMNMDGMRSHGITNFQSFLRKESSSSSSAANANANAPSNSKANSNARVRAFLNVNGGSTTATGNTQIVAQDVEEQEMSQEDVEAAVPVEVVEAVEETDDSIVTPETTTTTTSTAATTSTTSTTTSTTNPTTTTTAEAATGLASPPLRISTSQMGSNIISNNISKLSPRAARKREKRERRIVKKKLKQEEQSHKIYARKLKNRNNLNIGRKVLHAGCGFTFAFLNQVLPPKIFLPIMTIITTGTFAMECLRYRPGFGWMNDVLSFCLGGTLRKHEMEGKFTGSFYYFLGVVITARAFPTSCASLGIMQLALADPAASYFGRKTKNVYWSRIENGFFGIGRNKGVLGFLGGALVCFPFNFYALSIAKIHVGAATTVTTASIAAASLVLGLAGGFADLCVPSPALTMPKKICGVPMLPLHVDDNIVVPIFSGFACTKIFEYLGWGAAGVDLARFIII